jgi:hypothetical protein
MLIIGGRESEGSCLNRQFSTFGMGPQVSKTIIPQGWTIDIRSTAFAAIALAVVTALFAFLHRAVPQHQAWTPAPGAIQGTEIVPDHALETKSGGQVTWRAEYKISYSVASREYDGVDRFWYPR